MLTCIARSKNMGNGSPGEPDDSDSSNNKNDIVKSLASQLKDMALKASGAYKNCSTCTGPTVQSRIRSHTESDTDSDRFRWSYKRSGSSSSTTSMTWGKEMEARLKGISSGEGTPISASASGRRTEPIVLFVEEKEPKEWVAQVEPAFLSPLCPCRVAGTISSEYDSGPT